MTLAQAYKRRKKIGVGTALLLTDEDGERCAYAVVCTGHTTVMLLEFGGSGLRWTDAPVTVKDTHNLTRAEVIRVLEGAEYLDRLEIIDDLRAFGIAMATAARRACATRR